MISMENKNYLIIELNTVTNIIVWDGNSQTWTPPADSIQLVKDTTPAMVWSPIIADGKITDWELKELFGGGDVGFFWDGLKLTTNQPKPAIKKG